MKKIVVIFPGAGYSLDCPLLYYADFLFETAGYERICMNYEVLLRNNELPFDEKIKQMREYEIGKVQNVDFSCYDKIVFVSKSVGTVEAGWLAEYLGINVQQIFLTPIKEAIDYCVRDCKIVIGTKDAAFSVYKDYCEHKLIKTLYIEGANHSLEIEGKPYESIDALKRVMRFMMDGCENV